MDLLNSLFSGNLMTPQAILKSVRDLDPDDILAEDIVDRGGKIIFPRGTPLDSSHVSALIDLHLFTVRVSKSAPARKPELARTPDAAEIDRMFQPHMSNPLMAALCRAAQAHHKARRGGGSDT
jgi:hypothetical protein